MASKVILPKLGQTMEEGTIVEWLVAEGAEVARGDVLCTIESDKAVLEVESRAKGTLLKILLEPGIKAPVLSPIGVIGAPGEDIADLLAEDGGAAATEAAPAAAPAAETAPAPAAAAAPPPAPIERERIFSSPRARRLAAEKGVDLAYVAGSGPNGRIIEKDVVAYVAAQPAATPLARKVAAEQGVALTDIQADGRIRASQVTAPAAPAAPMAPAAPASGAVTPMAGVRAIIADRMGTSAHTTASVTLQSVVDVTEFVALRMKLRDAYAKELGFNVGYNDVLVAIVARCLVEHPEVNARLEEVDGKQVIRQLDTVNMGMAVDSGRGLLVPVIRDAQAKRIVEISKDFRDLVDRAREGRSGPDDLTGGTFTITNLGMFGIDQFTPIINLPECAILGVGRIKAEPVVVDGEVVVRQRMWLSLTFDHRLVDGAPAARFLQSIMRYIEAPYLLLG